jgi:hypothetical protein
VESFVPGGPAELYLSRGKERILPGDTLVEINGVMCYACSVEWVSKMISGPSGSWVQLGFKRIESDGVTKVIRVRLERRPFDVFPSRNNLAQVSDTDCNGVLDSGILKNQGQRRHVEQKSVKFKPQRFTKDSDQSKIQSASASSRTIDANHDLDKTLSGEEPSPKLVKISCAAMTKRAYYRICFHGLTLAKQVTL